MHKLAFFSGKFQMLINVAYGKDTIINKFWKSEIKSNKKFNLRWDIYINTLPAKAQGSLQKGAERM